LAPVRKKVEALNAYIAVPLDKAYFQALSRKFGRTLRLAKSGLNLKPTLTSVRKKGWGAECLVIKAALRRSKPVNHPGRR
jgi:hypothetical protein